MPERIVNALEVVKVTHYHAEAGILPRRALQRALQIVYDCRTVPYAGQPIMGGFDMQLFMEPEYPFRDPEAGRQEFFVKWLGNKIIRARIHALEVIALGVHGCKKDDISILQAMLRTNQSAQLQTIYMWHHPVGDE
jgi:hypothetical protein